MSRSSAIDIFGLVSGIISIIALLIHAVRSHLPAVKMEELDGLLMETESLFHDAQEQGLLKSSRFVEQTKESLENFQNSAMAIRAQVHSATSLSAQFLEMLKGLSKRISTVSKQVKTVRAKISTTSAREKERLRQSALTDCVPASAPNTTGTLADEPDSSCTPPLPVLHLDRTETSDSSDSTIVGVDDEAYVKAETMSSINTSHEVSPVSTE
ncbi:hypothetical protein DENSPDRAFT_843511 [Dentipellis sp. KUC8613]|nr:hypothetical protein DENSPDRAFT_843511 [Dentipellis sp. KUC8613]